MHHLHHGIATLLYNWVLVADKDRPWNIPFVHFYRQTGLPFRFYLVQALAHCFDKEVFFVVSLFDFDTSTIKGLVERLLFQTFVYYFVVRGTRSDLNISLSHFFSITQCSLASLAIDLNLVVVRHVIQSSWRFHSSLFFFHPKYMVKCRTYLYL